MMKNDFSELQHHSNAIDFLSDSLKEGSLVLFLGAGASKGFGLPDWVELVNLMRNDVGLPILTTVQSAEDLQLAADEVKDKLNNTDSLIELISKHLYPDSDALLGANVFDNHLLVSISALMMGSKRGHVSKVITLNYDNMLEWFLSIFGFVVRTIYELPALEGSEDVRIYHPHGFIPNPKIDNKKSKFVILGLSSANKRLGTPGDSWFEMVRHILNTGKCLFIGMSSNSLIDRALAPLFETCGELHKGVRPLGIWALLDEPNSTIRGVYSRSNIVPVVFTDVPELCDFLLKICQNAIKKPL